MKKFLPLLLTVLFAVSALAQDVPFEYHELRPDKKVLDSVVLIDACSISDFGFPIDSRRGSGVVIYKSDKAHPSHPDFYEGLILTAHHVVDDVSRISLKFRTSDRETRGAKVIGKDLKNDLAVVAGLIHKDAKVLKIATIVPSSGDSVKGAGYALGKTLRYHSARVLQMRGRNLMLDHIVQCGMSGGCVVNENNEIVGIISAGTHPEYRNTEDERYYGNCLTTTLLSIRRLVYDQGILRNFDEGTR